VCQSFAQGRPDLNAHVVSPVLCWRLEPHSDDPIRFKINPLSEGHRFFVHFPFPSFVSGLRPYLRASSIFEIVGRGGEDRSLVALLCAVGPGEK
jgi:hypothetical protein